jgi:hypothetical protein
VYPAATAFGCDSGDIAAVCSFGTKDTLDQVKGFYDKSVGGLHAAKHGYVMVLRSGKQTEGEGTTSTVFATAHIASLPAATMPPAGDPKAQEAARRLKYVSALAGGIGWPNAGRAWTAEELSRTGFRSPDAFSKVFQQYRNLESAYYPKDQAEAAKQRYDAKMAAIRKQYEQAGEQSGRRAQSDFDQMMKNQARQQQSMQRQSEEDCKRGPTAQQKADHDELARIIKKNSAERYRRFVAAEEKMKKAGCGPMTPGSPGMQAGMEIGQVISEDPEAIEFTKKMQARGPAQPKNPQGEALVKETRAMQEQGPKEMNEQWQAGLDYLAALDKIAFRTRITISGEKFGADAGGIVTDRAKVEDLWAKRKVSVAQEDESEDRGTGGAAAASSAGSKPAGAAPAKPGQGAPAGKPPARQPEKQDGNISTDDAVKAGKEGFNALKKLF